MSISKTLSEVEVDQGLRKRREKFQKVGALRVVKEDSIREKKESTYSLIQRR